MKQFDFRRFTKKNAIMLFFLVVIAFLLYFVYNYTSREGLEGSTCAARSDCKTCLDSFDSTGSTCYWCKNKGCVNPDDYYDCPTCTKDKNCSIPDGGFDCGSPPIPPDPSPRPPGPPPPPPGPGPTPCPPGQYNSDTGQTPCMECDAGTYAPYDFNFTCQKCPAGTTSEPGSTKCVSSSNPSQDQVPVPEPEPASWPIDCKRLTMIKGSVYMNKD